MKRDIRDSWLDTLVEFTNKVLEPFQTLLIRKCIMQLSVFWLKQCINTFIKDF